MPDEKSFRTTKPVITAALSRAGLFCKSAMANKSSAETKPGVKKDADSLPGLKKPVINFFKEDKSRLPTAKK
ncbi:hypothetical protein [Mucilaginibacter sp. NFX135]|uniref:hypothetical protein n=1 Tax=Mucilaginibacter sp. NFX135 TaxID=3402687 RepID=UPI003AFB3DB1